MIRGVTIAVLIAAAAPASAASDSQTILSTFLADADGRAVKKIDREMAQCIIEHASRGKTNKLVELAAANNQKSFVKLLQRTAGKNRELESCLEGAALTAMMGF